MDKAEIMYQSVGWSVGQGVVIKVVPNETFESNLRSVARSFVHPWSGNWVVIGRAVVYYARAAQAFSAGIKLNAGTADHTCLH